MYPRQLILVGTLVDMNTFHVSASDLLFVTDVVLHLPAFEAAVNASVLAGRCVALWLRVLLWLVVVWWTNAVYTASALFVCVIASQHTLNQLRLQQYTTPTVYVSS